jgi:hypothetical protein
MMQQKILGGPGHRRCFLKALALSTAIATMAEHHGVEAFFSQIK